MLFIFVILWLWLFVDVIWVLVLGFSEENIDVLFEMWFEVFEFKYYGINEDMLWDFIWLILVI